MGTRNRVLSFMSQFSNHRDSQRSPTPTSSNQPVQASRRDSAKHEPTRQDLAREPTTPPRSSHPYNMEGESSQPRVPRERVSSRPMSMVQTYQPPLMDVNQDTLPELQPIFTFLNSHGNKLYQEGYFLKLDDQNTHGRANADRTWAECFAQLVGTVLSLWDAAELDAAGQDGEVLPKFINLTDASIKMIESLPTRSQNEAPLQNVLSISTAGKNRYLLHFNSHHSLIQWTAGIRLAMFEHATLQEAYTGALIAGKGKGLNNINVIMERSKLKSEDWARVRFGAGTPWRRCWCVITPPDEKEAQKLQKQQNKKKSAYDRSRLPTLKGDIKFYDSKKTKKVRPIATITDAYSAFAIYPQSKPLIDASTLVKVEGSITIHSDPPSSTEGFVFVMPEVHPAVTGFEMMLRWLFPVFDTFALYGRPGRLIADTSDPNSLMFAMPKHRRYGYLEILDVSGLILEQGSSNWRELEWRRRMKDLTGKRMTAIENASRTNSRYSSRRSTRNSFGPTRSRVRHDDGASIRSSPSITWGGDGLHDGSQGGVPRTDSAPPGADVFTPPRSRPNQHQRAVSDNHGLDRLQNQGQSLYDGTYEEAPAPPPHSIGVASGQASGLRYNEMASTPERISSDDEQSRATPVRELQELQAVSSPEPVAAPPAFSHAPGSMPASKPYQSPELRRANSRMSNATLSQLAGAGGVAAAYHSIGERTRTSEDQRRKNGARYSEELRERGVMPDANTNEFPANQDGLNEGLIAASNSRLPSEQSPPRHTNVNSPSDFPQPPPQPPYRSPNNLVANSQLERNRNVQPMANKAQATDNNLYDPSRAFISAASISQPSRYQQGRSADTSEDPARSTASQPPRLQTSQSVARKPLPTSKSSIQTPTSADTLSSTGSLQQHSFDQAAFDMIGRDNGRNLTPQPETRLNRPNSEISSIYENAASSANPDYASIRPPPRESFEKPRTGVMRTVGNADDEEGRSGGGKDSLMAAIPNVDFGPTLNYSSNRFPRQASPVRSSSPLREQIAGPTVNNYPAERPHDQRNTLTNAQPSGEGQSRSPNRKAVAPENAHYRNDSGEGRTVAWQPGMGAPGRQQGISAEQFVQQRAAASTPLYAHQRQPSGTVLRANTPTPPPLRNRSSDALAQQGHSRNSTDLLQRPASRGLTTAVGPSGSGDMASTLSAREQEHIARVSGQPLINMAQNSRPSSSGTGLVGTIETREREKQQMKQGINSQAIQHAIAQRQQQAMYQQYPGQTPGEYRAPQSEYGMIGKQLPQPPYAQNQRQQSWVSPAASVFAQGGGWTAPAPAYGMPSEQGRQSPSQYPLQQQYFNNLQQQQGQGRGDAGYQGRGY